MASGVGGRQSPAGFFGAVLIHAAVVAATMFTWQHRLDIADESPPIVPVDLVTIGRTTNIAPAVQPVPRVEPEQPKPEEPQPQVQPPTPVPPPPSVPQDQSEPAPPPPPSVVPSLRPEPQPQTKPATKPNKFDVDNVFALLNKVAPQKSSQTAPSRSTERPHQGFGAQNAMTMELRDALKNAIEQCWSPPAGAPHPEELVVYIDLSLNPDGSVARPPQLAAQSATAVANPYFHAAADAAMRAIYVCAPYKLPADRYEDWRDSTIEFDPRDLAAQ